MMSTTIRILGRWQQQQQQQQSRQSLHVVSLFAKLTTAAPTLPLVNNASLSTLAYGRQHQQVRRFIRSFDNATTTTTTTITPHRIFPRRQCSSSIISPITTNKKGTCLSQFRSSSSDANTQHDDNDNDNNNTTSPPIISNRVYVGNLSWSTTPRDLELHLAEVTGREVTRANVMYFRDGRSKGCGIVEFATLDGAAAAIETCTDTVLKGRKLFAREDREPGQEGRQRQSSGGGGDGNGRSSSSHPRNVHYMEPGSKLFVGNLSKEVGWPELRDHFGRVAKVDWADVVMDRGEGNYNNEKKNKGFGFVRFYSASDAKRAMEELNGMEFMGQVLEIRLDDRT